jgi:hypothetical protein
MAKKAFKRLQIALSALFQIGICRRCAVSKTSMVDTTIRPEKPAAGTNCADGPQTTLNTGSAAAGGIARCGMRFMTSTIEQYRCRKRPAEGRSSGDG